MEYYPLMEENYRNPDRGAYHWGAELVHDCNYCSTEVEQQNGYIFYSSTYV